MYERIWVSENAGYIDCPAKIGLITEGCTVYAIDSGNEAGAAKKVLKAIREQGWELKAVFNTHSHADHIGGNRYLQEQTGCAVYAPTVERCFAEFPIMEPAFLYGGFPLKDLRHKFLLAQESRVDTLTEDVLPNGVQILPLPGHCCDMVGFRTAEDVVFLADCLASEETITKYGLVFLWDVEAYLDTLRRVQTMEAKLFIPSHAAPTENIAPLAKFNIDATLRAGDLIAGFCREPRIFEDLLREIFRHYGTTMNAAQYALVGSTLRSYLAWLQNTERLDCIFEDHRMLWVAKP